jgi:hypothetical protein
LGNRGDIVFVSGQAKSKNAKITVKIYYGGELIKEATSSGDFVIASTSDSLKK